MSASNVPRNVAYRVRRPSPRPAARKRPSRPPVRWRLRAGVAAAAGLAALLAWAAIARSYAPTSNTSLTHFDTIVVLGNPADSDGNPTPVQLARVTESVNEYKRGVAPHLIVSGGAAANRFVEARVMARTAEAQGVPASAIFIEPDSLNTIQNACNSERIMKAHGWNSAEVVTSPSHLQRSGMIFNSMPLQWSGHAAPPLSPESGAYQSARAGVEVLKTARYLIWARWVDRCEP